MVNIHVYPSPLTHESRILRITDALARAGIFQTIEVVGVLAPGLATREALDAKRSLVRLPRRLLPGGDGFLPKLVRTLEWSVRVLLSLRGRRIDCINAHSLAVLPLCAVASWMTGARLVYDTHELETETSGYRGVRQRVGRAVERTLIGRCSLVFAVSGAIADWYATTYRMVRPVVVRNIPQYAAQQDGDTAVVRARMGLRPGRLAFIYQGGFIAGRGVERLLRVFAASPQVDLVCMGSGPLRPLVEQAAAAHGNIRLLPPVLPSEVLQHSRAADVGVCLTDDSCLSHYYSLPNKVFEYLHAGLPVIVNPLLEQQRLVQEFGCGWVAPADDAAFTEMLARIDAEAIATKRAAVAHAARALNWADEEARLVAAYREHGLG